MTFYHIFSLNMGHSGAKPLIGGGWGSGGCF